MLERIELDPREVFGDAVCSVAPRDKGIELACHIAPDRRGGCGRWW